MPNLSACPRRSCGPAGWQFAARVRAPKSVRLSGLGFQDHSRLAARGIGLQAVDFFDLELDVVHPFFTKNCAELLANPAANCLLLFAVSVGLEACPKHERRLIDQLDLPRVEARHAQLADQARMDKVLDPVAIHKDGGVFRSANQVANLDERIATR